MGHFEPQIVIFIGILGLKVAQILPMKMMFWGQGAM
jgi:hypothetical protein